MALSVGNDFTFKCHGSGKPTNVGEFPVSLVREHRERQGPSSTNCGGRLGMMNRVIQFGLKNAICLLTMSFMFKMLSTLVQIAVFSPSVSFAPRHVLEGLVNSGV